MTNIDFIKQKRVGLTTFIHDQLIGPGAYGYKFGIDGENDKVDILDVTPGSIYCSGILFPKKKHGNDSGDSSKDDNTQAADALIKLVDRSDDDDDTSQMYDEEDIRQLTQRYPDSFGISCCIGKPDITSDDLTVKLSGRFYTKIQRDNLNHVYVVVEETARPLVCDILKMAIQIDGQGQTASLGNYFSLMGEGHLHLTTLNFDDNSTIRIILDKVDRFFSKEIANRHGTTDPCYGKPANGMLLASYKEKVFDRLNQTKNDNVSSCSKTIELIEEKEAALSYFKDLITMLNRKGYGFWMSHDFAFNLDLTKVDFSQKIIRPSAENGLLDIPLLDVDGKPIDSPDAKLSVWLQLIKDSRDKSNDKTYFKILVENTSKPFEETAKKYYSIVTEGVNCKCFFGVTIDLYSEFLEPYGIQNDFDGTDKEQARLQYIYRKVKDYGVGHLCSVDWEPRKATHIWSEFMPSFNTPDVDVVPQKVVAAEDGHYSTEDLISNTTCLQFKELSTLSDSDDGSIVKELRAFADTYRKWIDNAIVDNDVRNKEHVKSIRENCLSDYQRITANIGMLDSSRKAMLAFRLMNTAMFMQLWHSVKDNRELAAAHQDSLDEDFYRDADPEIRKGKGPAAWRSFQLAFILLNLDGIIKPSDDPDWHNRNNLVDLVWFPTGGGKTEAYLGIIAFTILYRRLSYRDSAGTTAIMRYTLRLLATQQFQRALRLILALEQIRKWEMNGRPRYSLGTAINIGLFVGGDALPNTVADQGQGANRVPGLNTEGNNWNNNRPSKIPFEEKKCPWCGSEMRWDETMKTTVCSNAYCAFGTDGGGIPVLLCDELIYNTPPTLLFGTADKFAAIAHKVSEDNKSNSRRLFKLNSLTPDLIIQDELHLLEGPLGSAFGLFENAIDELSSRKGPDGRIIRPKVISSTATTRNTEFQILALFDREVNVFPKNGVDYDDSFFAFYKRNPADAREYDSKRKYIGILPTGRTSMYTQIRLAACCFTHRALFEKEHISDISNEDFIKAADYYYSLISYFNNKKDVANTAAQFDTEFPKYTRQVFHRILRPKLMLECFYAMNRSFSSAELTGRLRGNEVISSLGDVQRNWNPDTRIPHYNSEGTFVAGVTPPDLILATNMISVGIDVSRFNLMIINSMPRNKAEYIQATSRVAREQLGIVFTLHNPYRARDLSHFEKFREFHEKLYYYVDPISVTPYSPQAIRKYLPLVIASIMRHENFGLSLNKDIQSIDENKAASVKDKIMQIFQARYDSIRAKSHNDPLLSDIISDSALKQIAEFVDDAMKEWIDKKASLQFFDNEYDRASSLFLSLDAYEDEKSSTKWSVPYSIRDIAESSVIKIKNN